MYAISIKQMASLLVAIISLSLFTCCETLFPSTEQPIVNNYVLTATGQITAYNENGEIIDDIEQDDSLYGQDAHYISGSSMSYTDNGNGTITDDVTGLMWQQDPSASTYTWEEAVDYCNALKLGGYDDWRMPSAKELFSLSDFNEGWPYLNTEYFYLASGNITKDEQYWTMNYYVGITVEGGNDAAFGVNFVTGHIKAYPADATGPIGGKYVRAVRGDDYGINELIDNGDGTITDNATGLMWMQEDSKETMDWKHALAYAENASIAGYTDWRLPNIKELQSIVDYDYAPGASESSQDGPAIDPMFSCTPITNEAGLDDYGYYWSSTSAHFTSGEPYYYAWYTAVGRAVNPEGDDFHGAGAVRFDTKFEDGPNGQDGERYYNFVRLVRDTD